MPRSAPAPELQVDSAQVTALIREAVDQRHMSLSEIAGLSGLSVTTPARIYHGSMNQVRITTARRIAEALGYDLKTSSTGKVLFERMAEKKESRKLTALQKDRIMKAVMQTLRGELDRL